MKLQQFATNCGVTLVSCEKVWGEVKLLINKMIILIVQYVGSEQRQRPTNIGSKIILEIRQPKRF